MEEKTPTSKRAKKGKTNNTKLGDLYAKAMEMDRDVGGLEIEEYKDEENSW